MMKRESGAGQVSLLWVVFLIVLVLGLAGFTYIAFKDKAQVEQELIQSKNDATNFYNIGQETKLRLDQLSDVVGYRESKNASSNTTSIQDTIAMAKDKYPEYVSQNVKTLDETVSGIHSAFDATKQQLQQAQQSLDEQMELRKKAEETVNTIETDKNARISELEAQLSDEQQRSQNQVDEDNQRIANLQSQLDEADQKARDAENQRATQEEKYKNEINVLQTRVLAQAQKLEVLREPDKPDGRILSSSTRTGLAVIDAGRKDGLRIGTKFEVLRQGKGGTLTPKDPIMQGDVITNPHFARDMQRTFVFLGEFPADMDKDFVKERLTELGAVVKDTVDSTTDFLVLGRKEPGEDSQDLTESPEFKLATQLGVQILRVRDLASFVKF
jgi:NAD-dependent DNA ligase